MNDTNGEGRNDDVVLRCGRCGQEYWVCAVSRSGRESVPVVIPKVPNDVRVVGQPPRPPVRADFVETTAERINAPP